MYHRSLLLLILGFASVYIRGEDCDKLGILLYEDLGCKPQGAQEGACPSHYECDEFTNSNETCLFQSKRIPIGESVDDDLIYGACRIGCHCILNEDKNTTGFNCAVLDCPEWLGAVPQRPDCYSTFTLNKCCSTGEKCPPFDNQTKCVVDENEYKEGEIFNPSNTCLSCVCQEGFDGKFEPPFCKKSTCAEQIDNSEKLIENCAPVYFGATPCCPSEWACPSSTDQIKQIDSKSALNSNLTCKWGEHVLKLGESSETKIEHFDEVKDITCECVLPPLLTCKETKK